MGHAEVYLLRSRGLSAHKKTAEDNLFTLTLFWQEEFQRDLFYVSKTPALQCLVLCRQTTMKLTRKWKKPKIPVLQGFSAKEKVR